MKTRKPDAAERIAEKHIRLWLDLRASSIAFKQMLASDIRRAIAAAKRPVWKPMSEPPEPAEVVLLSLNGVRRLAYANRKGTWYDGGGPVLTRDGYWTELPPPPKARKGASK